MIERGDIFYADLSPVIGSEQGVEYAQQHLPAGKTTLWLGAVDAELTSKAYIVPGIGDAGDLAFGDKL